MKIKAISFHERIHVGINATVVYELTISK